MDFFQYAGQLKKHWRKATSSDHDATCNVSYRTAVALSKLLTPLHCHTLPQHPKVLKSNWNIPLIVMIINIYVLCMYSWKINILDIPFLFLSLLFLFLRQKGGRSFHIATAPWIVAFVVIIISLYFARKPHQERCSAWYSDQREVDQCSIKWRFNRFKPLSLIVIVI